MLLPLALAAGAAILAIVTALGSSGDRPEDPAAPPGTEAIVGQRGPQPRGITPMAQGAVDAPVVMIMYSEFQCPFCGRYARETEPELVERFVTEGTLRIEWRDLPFLGDESFLAATAGRAAAEQDAFWPFAERLYSDQPEPNSGGYTKQRLLATADAMGLDTDRFERTMDDPATRDAVRDDLDEAVSFGISGTPAFFINGEVIIGAQPTRVFVDMIENAAAQASQ